MRKLSSFRAWSLSFVLMWLGCHTALAEGISWEQAITQVQRSADEYRTYAVDVGGTAWAGTAYNGYHYDRHRCAIVGRMLGKLDSIKELEELDYPPLDTTQDPHDLLVFSISLDSWVLAARRAVDMTEAEHTNVWNLDCVGEMGISASDYIDHERPEAVFSFEDGTLTVYGDIDFGFFERFVAALNEYPSTERIGLGSGGGSVRDALLTGYEIRLRGLDTTLYGNCFSACPLVFMGGEERVLWATPSRLGFHQIYTGDGEAVPLSAPVYERTAVYLAQMGVDPVTVIGWMAVAGPREMYEPPVDELCAPRVATFVLRVCGW